MNKTEKIKLSQEDEMVLDIIEAERSLAYQKVVFIKHEIDRARIDEAVVYAMYHYIKPSG